MRGNGRRGVFLILRWLLYAAIAGALIWVGLVVFMTVKEKTVRTGDGSDTQAIIVLGAQVNPDGSLSVQLQWRLDKALELYRAYPQRIVVCGAQGTGEPVTEAQAMRDYLAANGVAENDILMEDSSFNTRQNLQNAKKLLAADSPRVLIVTSDYHLPLSCLLFTETALLYECEYGYAPYAVVSNLGLRGYGLNEYKNPEEQALYVWNVARPQPNA